MIDVTLVIPNREGHPPTLYEDVRVFAVPRYGEGVSLRAGTKDETTWVVKGVGHEFLGTPGGPRINVYLIEPNHWSLQQEVTGR